MTDVPVETQQQLPMLQSVQKTVETPPIQSIDTAVDVPVMAQRPVHLVQRVQNTVEMPVVQFSDRVVEMPAVTQRQVPMIPNVQKTVANRMQLFLHFFLSLIDILGKFPRVSAGASLLSFSLLLEISPRTSQRRDFADEEF